MIVEIVTFLILCILLYVVFYVKITLLVVLSVILIVAIVGYTIWRFLRPKSIETFEFHFRDDAVNVEERPEIYCGDDTTLPPDYDRMGTRGSCLKKGIGLGMSLPDSQRDAFLRKPPKPPKTENLYCGNAEVLPNGYDGFDTLSNCLKRGVGVGLHMPQQKRLAFQAKPSRGLGKKEIMDLARRLKIKNPANMTREGALRSISRKLV